MTALEKMRKKSAEFTKLKIEAQKKELIQSNFQIVTATLLLFIIILEGGTTARHQSENIKEYKSKPLRRSAGTMEDVEEVIKAYA